MYIKGRNFPGIVWGFFLLLGEIAKSLSQLMYVSLAAASLIPGGVHLGFLSVTGLDACRGLPAASEGLDITLCLGSELCSVIQEGETIGDAGMEKKITLERFSLAEKSSLKMTDHCTAEIMRMVLDCIILKQ